MLQIKDYVDGRGQDVPLLLLGGAGSGKSSIMARAVDATLTAAIDRKIPGSVTAMNTFHLANIGHDIIQIEWYRHQYLGGRS